MPLEKVSTILKDASIKGYGVVGFNAFNFESIAWIIETAEEENTPVIAMLYPSKSKHIPYSTFAAITKDLASKARIPVGLHLDHCTSFTEIMGAIASGFTSVMIDGSALPFDENVKATAEVVKSAHAMGVDVEAELGRVGFAANSKDFTDSRGFTDPGEAAEFVELTGVDSLAVAIGSAHGNYVATPKLDLGRLEEISKAVKVPLVLHGGTGIPDEQIRKAVKLGIRKLNVGTGYSQIQYDKAKEAIEGNKANHMMTNLVALIKNDSKEFVRDRIRSVKD